MLSRLAERVYTVERHAALAKAAAERLRELGCDNVVVRHGDGSEGWGEHAPYDAIVVAAASPAVPGALREQLRAGGRLVIPVGGESQHLQVVTRTTEGFTTEIVEEVYFVPLRPGTVR